jgi:hypothetical protein
MRKKLFLFILVIPVFCFCQVSSPKLSIAPITGTIVAGYVDKGAYLNFTGPNLSFNKSGHTLLFGMLPSLRFKKDTGATKNSLVTPGLGFGLTYCFKAFAIQVPLYYNSKTSLKNGNWQFGIRLGFKISALNSKNKK